jgi:hypothetical protein
VADLYGRRLFLIGLSVFTLASLAAMMLWAFGIFGIYFFTSIYLQTILGFSPTKAGWRSCRWPSAWRCPRWRPPPWPPGSGRTAPSGWAWRS